MQPTEQLPHDSAALKTFRAFILILAVIGCTYWPTLWNGFVWDDTALILRDPLIRSWRLIPEGFRHFLFLDATGSDFYRPLQRLSYTLDYALYGFSPGGYHLSNCLLHAAAAMALFLLLKRFLSDWQTLAVTVLWAVHPVHSSAVAYASGRADILAALLGFAGLYLVLKQDLLWGTLCLLGAALSKEVGLVFLPISLVLVPKEQRRSLARALALVFVAYLCLRLTAERTPPPPGEAVPIAARPILFSRAIAENTGLILAPVNLHMERDLSSTVRGISPAEATRKMVMRDYQTLLGWALFAGVIWWFHRTRHGLLVAFAIAYLPTSNLLTLNASAAEHWLYIPLAFLLAAAALSLKNRWILPLALLWAVSLGGRTFLRTFDWKDERTFLEKTIRAGGASSRMYVQLGNLESSQGNHVAAIQHIEKALLIAPEQPMALLAMANAQLRNGDYAAARRFLDKTAAFPWLRSKGLETLSVLEYRKSGQVRPELLAEAVALEPNFWPLRKRYLQLLDQCGRTTEALKNLGEFLNAAPYRAEAWVLLGQLLEKADQPQAAARAWEQAEAYDLHLSRNR